MQTGFIGLGNLGTAIAENLLQSGVSLYVYNRTTSKAEALKEKGAVVCHSIQELVSQCDIVFSVVSDDAALNNITTAPEGIAAHLRKGGIHVSLSTILPSTSEALHQVHQQHGSIYLTCPVMARPEVVRARKIQFLVSGDGTAIQTIKPLLEKAGAAGIWEFGSEVGAANVAKLCSNYLILSAMEAMAEGINLAERSGIDPRFWMGMLTQTFFNAPAYINYSKIILDKAFEPASFSLRLGAKDMNLVLQQAESVQAAMPVGQQVQTLLKQSIAAGLGEQDVTAVSKFINEQSQS